MKTGYKTSEFWITILLSVAGMILLTLGKDNLGTALLAAGGFSYSTSRGLAKLGAK